MAKITDTPLSCSVCVNGLLGDDGHNSDAITRLFNEFTEPLASRGVHVVLVELLEILLDFLHELTG